MRVYMPIMLTIAFLIYLSYLAFVKKDLKRNLKTTVYPAIFFILVWGIWYFMLWQK